MCYYTLQNCSYIRNKSQLFLNSQPFIINPLSSIADSTMSQNTYNPLQWPPDINLAQLHFNCCKPGIDNTEGRQCPCCNRFEKLTNRRWPLRDIVKDFKNYGGGIPGYFHLIIYLIVVLIILCGVAVIYHIMLLDQVCPTLIGTKNHCASTMGVFYFCDTETLYNTLVANGNQTQATVLQAIQLATYLILVIATIGIKVILHVLNKGRSLDGKLFSRFSLMIKNIPLYYQLQDLKKEILQIDSSIVIEQIFYVFKTCECQKNFKILCDLYFRMKQAEENLQMDNREKFQKEYRKMKGEYLQHFDKYQKELRNLKASSKKVVIVFNTIQQKEKVHKALRMNELKKFFHYFSKMLGYKRESIGYYTQRIAQPQEVHWKYIGQSSTHKMKVRISSTIIGLGLIAASFGIFYMPMLQIDIDKIEAPSIGSPLGFVVSFILFILMIIYRIVVKGLIPYRKPSSKLAEGYFMVLTCTIFNFCFYLISPACFYIFTTTIPNQYKLVELFMNGFSFSIFSLFLNFLDLGYLGFNGKKKKLLNKITIAKAFCQSRLHEEVTPPPFPVAFKLVMVFNVWIFNGFYVFNIPYLLLFFLGVLFFLYWIDKFILYNHYKMQSYLSVELEHKAQKFFLVIFIICVSLGYLTITQFQWQKWLVLAVFVVGIIINFSLQFFFKKQKDEVLKHDSDLRGAIERCKSDAIATNTLNMMQQQMKNSLFLNDPSAFAKQISEASLATAIFMYGYQQTYSLYLNQFDNKKVHKMLEDKYISIKKSISSMSGHKEKKRQSQLAQVLDQSLKNKLMDKSKGQLLNNDSPQTAKFFESPKAKISRFQSSASQDSKNPQQSNKQQRRELVKAHQERYYLSNVDRREQMQTKQEQQEQSEFQSIRQSFQDEKERQGDPQRKS